MMIATLTIASHGQTSKPVSSAKSSLGQPFWRAKVMENEPVLFIRNEGKPFATGKLLFMPSAKPTIMAPDLVMKYEEGKDYVWKPGFNIIELTAGTRIPFKTSAEMVPPPGSPNTLMGVLFAEGYFFHDLQVQVSYQHVDKWPLQDAPEAQRLTRSLAKLKAKQPFKLVALGDSITAGCNASGAGSETLPHQPAYPQLVANTLQQRFGASVTLTNLARGGTGAGWGLEMVAKVAAEKPDLVILAFGMNHSEPAAGFEAVMRRLRDAVQAACPEADIVMVAPMTDNPCGFPPERFTGYREVLRNLTGPNVALADVTSPWLELLKRKPFSDLSGNNINHPNDFGHRVYAQIISELFPLKSESIQSAAVKSVRLILPKQPGPVVENTGKVFARQVQQRCEAKVVTGGAAPLTVELAVEKGICAEGFRIEDRKGGGVRIVGNDERGLVAGVGKFLRTSRYDKGGFTPGTWRGTSVPQKPVRGIYFATHFNNFYHEAPVDEIQRYVEDLALWGLNELVVWYDMHHFNGFEDPEAVKFRKRLHDIMAAAKQIGMDVSLVFPGNEAYGNSPAELRASGGGRGAVYPCAVCPSKPEGMKYILKVLGEEFDWAADLKPRSVWIWPYDAGGCGCAECKPWGSKGFMKCVREVGKLARKKLPGTEIFLSTWFLDNNEWQGVKGQLAGEKKLVDGIISEPPHGPPIKPEEHGLPMVGFPEISMHETFPWGGFGATPLTARSQGQWNAAKGISSGGFPYSEGLFEDLTKAVYSQFYWNDQPAAETVKEYIAFEFSPDVVADVAGVVKTLEQNHHWRWWPGMLEGVKLQMDWFPSRGAAPQADPGAEEAYAAMQRVNELLTPQAKTAWRWRQLYLRALLDAELKTNGGNPNEKCNEAFAELIKIYHAENADPTVRPPLPKKSPPRDPTTVASSEFSADCHAGKACDGVRASQDENNFWASANRQDVGAWWRKDLGNRLSIEKIRIQFRGFDGRYHFVPKTITFQVSDDGKTWTTAVSKSADVPANNSPYAATMHTYDINAKGRYVRVLFEDGTDDEVNNNKVVELVEVEVVRAGSAPVGNK